MRTARIVPFVVVMTALVVLPWCTCQRPENVEAKARLSRPAPPDKSVKAAEDKLDAEALGDAAVMKRAVSMEGQEIAARLGSFSFTGDSELSFTRGESVVRASEKSKVLQASNGDFAVETTTGDGSLLRLAYVNEIFFLKNNNGQWRMSRDPQGDRNTYRSDAVQVWKAFYELVSHVLVVDKIGSGRHEGRDVVKYRLTIPDQSAAAATEGASVPQPPQPQLNDAGVLEDVEPPADKKKRIHDRLGKWRERAKPAGGSGELWVDASSGVPLVVKFVGNLAVGDGPATTKLHVQVDQTFHDVGKDQKVPMPKDAIDEIVRTKMPVRPREVLEDEGIVAPLPRDGGPAGAVKPKAKPDGELPDDE
jgi:hypothetical protein